MERWREGRGRRKGSRGSYGMNVKGLCSTAVGGVGESVGMLMKKVSNGGEKTVGDSTRSLSGEKVVSLILCEGGV